MDSEYILVCKWGSTELLRKFHAATPEAAEETARRDILDCQSQNVMSQPFAPEIVEGELYRQIKELSGAEFVTTAPAQAHPAKPAPKS